VLVLVLALVLALVLELELVLILVLELELELELELALVLVIALVLVVVLVLVLVLVDCSPNASIGANGKAWQGPKPETFSEPRHIAREIAVKKPPRKQRAKPVAKRFVATTHHHASDNPPARPPLPARAKRALWGGPRAGAARRARAGGGHRYRKV